MKLFSLFFKDEQGGGLVEYTLIIALIALAAVTAITSVGTKITTRMSSISSSI